jgi:hypothetical protein
MAEYQDKLMAELKEAMRSKNKQKRDTIRLLQAEMKQLEIKKRSDGKDPDLTTDEELGILQKEAKKRREAINELEEAGRADQAADEKAELDIIEHFLPEQMTEAEIEAIAQDVIEEVGADSMKDMGQVMGKVMDKVKGRADGNKVSGVVRHLLSK